MNDVGASWSGDRGDKARSMAVRASLPLPVGPSEGAEERLPRWPSASPAIATARAGGAARDAAVEFEWRDENAVDVIGNQALVRPELRYVAAGALDPQGQAGRAPS
jgi:hypothetical protein